MKRKHFIKSILMTGFAPSLLLYACSTREQENDADNNAKKQTFTCPMHPQIIQASPGTCPICAMDLVPFDKNNQDNFLMLSPRQQTLANISTIIVGSGDLRNGIRLNGRLVANPETAVYISSRIPGRIEQLHVKETGRRIAKGSPLFTIYSEELLVLQQEYLLAFKQAEEIKEDSHFKTILLAAEQKLLLYGKQHEQLEELRREEQMAPVVTYYAPFEGTVASIDITEGDYVDEGSAIIRLEHYDQLWVEADAYPEEAEQLIKGEELNVFVTGYDGHDLKMKVDFINPALAVNKQLVQIRGTIANPDGILQPGMHAQIALAVKNQGDKIIVPANAVIHDGKKEHVWVATDEQHFEARAVVTGNASLDHIELKKGVETGERLVVTGAYLLYSEFILKRGKDPVQ